jgi:hypothetical protein
VVPASITVLLIFAGMRLIGSCRASCSRNMAISRFSFAAALRTRLKRIERPAEQMECYPVGAAVGNVKNDEPELLAPIAAQPLNVVQVGRLG